MFIDRPLFSTLLMFMFAMTFLYLLYLIVSPFLTVLVWTGAVGIISYPLYEKLLRRCKENEIIASAILTAILALAVVLPLTGMMISLSREATAAYQFLEGATAGGSQLTLGSMLHGTALYPWVEKIDNLARQYHLDIDGMLLTAIKRGIAGLLEYSTGIVKNLFEFLLKMILMTITLFFIYKDGKRFMKRFWEVMPIRSALKTAIINTVSRVLGAVMYGIVLTCLMQGALGGIGFGVAGLPSPILFGALMALCAAIPIVGTALIWLPGSLYLLVQGEAMRGFLLIAWSAIVVSGIDNIFRPLFISGKAKLHILIIVFGVLGGVLAFGIAGVILGPVLMAVGLLLLDELKTVQPSP